MFFVRVCYGVEYHGVTEITYLKMICSIGRFSKGSASIDFLSELNIEEFFKIWDAFMSINRAEKREINKAKNKR